MCGNPQTKTLGLVIITDNVTVVQDGGYISRFLKCKKRQPYMHL
jgi:hypothetical protein